MRPAVNKHRLIANNACNNTIYAGIFLLTPLGNGVDYGINIFTFMSLPSDPSSKIQALKAAGAFNARADQVRHPLFEQSEFFDPQDLPQLKYEALRALHSDEYSMTRAAGEFGLSRPTLYQAQDQFEKQGLEGLLPRKRGPKKPHKLTPKVRQYLGKLTTSKPELNARELAARLHQKFKVKIHPRTLEKDLKPKVKRGRQTAP